MWMTSVSSQSLNQNKRRTLRYITGDIHIMSIIIGAVAHPSEDIISKTELLTMIANGFLHIVTSTTSLNFNFHGSISDMPESDDDIQPDSHYAESVEQITDINNISSWTNDTYSTLCIRDNSDPCYWAITLTMGTQTTRLQQCNFEFDSRYQVFTGGGLDYFGYVSPNGDMWIVISDIDSDDIPLNMTDDCYIAYIDNPENVSYSRQMTVSDAGDAISFIATYSITRSERTIREFMRQFGRVNARNLNMLGGE